MKNIREITLTKGMVAIVDTDNYDWLMGFGFPRYKCRWCYTGQGQNGGYAVKRINKKTVWMHRLIMVTPFGMHTHHINGDTLDNRKSNLIVLFPEEHMRKPRTRGLFVPHKVHGIVISRHEFALKLKQVRLDKYNPFSAGFIAIDEVIATRMERLLRGD